MNCRLLRVLAGAVLSLGTVGIAHAVTNGTQAGSFLLIGNGARATAMGEAFSAVADDLTAVSWNPAGLSQVPAPQVLFTYAAWFADTSYNVTTIGGPIAPGHAVAASLFYFHVPRIANVPEEVEPAVDLSNWAGGVSYAWAIFDRLSLGGGLKLLSQDIRQAKSPDSGASGATVDAGILYRHSDPEVSGAVVLQNMGPKMSFRDADAPAPFWARIGLGWGAYRDEFSRVTGSLDVSLPVDTRYRLTVPEGGLGEITGIALKGPTQDRMNFGLGMEWWMADILALRGGYTIRAGSDVNTPSGGAGLRFTVEPFVYSVDYCYSFWGPLSSNVSRVSFAIGLVPSPGTAAD